MARRWIPNTLTFINLFAGVGALLAACVQQWGLGVALVFAAALFESSEGRIARRLNATNENTKLMDSLADWISFGLAPAVMAYALCFAAGGWNGLLLVAVFPVCGIFRLARFNLSHVKSYYVGLPITVAGPTLAASAFLAQRLPLEVHASILLVLAGMMVSTIRVPKMH
jgi:CDP-diacylglycerol--serine O-phosphatidyltransferase